MTLEISISLFLRHELVSVLRANDPDTFKQWLCGGVQDLGKPIVRELHLRPAKGHAATRCAAMDAIRAKKTVLAFREEQG